MPTLPETAKAPRFSGIARADLCAIVILVVIAIVALATFRDYGLGWDDYTHAQYGDLLLALYGSGFTDRRALSFVNLYMYGGGFDMLAGLAAKILPFELFETRRLIDAAVGLAGLIATWRLARRIAGPWGGVIALVLLATCPLYYGHMFINAKDVPFAAAMALLLLGLVRMLEEYPSPLPASVALFGVGLGLAVGTRVVGVMAALYVAAALAFIMVAETRRLGARVALVHAARFIVLALPGVVIGYLIMGLVWPWSVVSPLNPLHALQYFSVFFEKPWMELFDGQLLTAPEMPRRYVPTLFALRLPEAFLALASAGTVVAIVTAARRDIPLARRATLVVVAAAATFPILIALITKPAVYNGIRHFIFVTPAMAAVGGFAGARLIDWLALRGRAVLVTGTAVLLLAIAAPIIELVRLHPYQYTSFNHLAGGVPGANGRYMLDYWGLSFKQASAALRAHLAARHEPTPDRKWKIAVCGPHPPAAVALGPDFTLTWDPAGADFALMLGAFYCARLDAPVIAEIDREGVLFARVYDIRGHSFPTLFTLPPVQ
jgi:dolichyl-phosphate-mannose-protein mannosyltransferase